jgi:hypothetical protein
MYNADMKPAPKIIEGPEAWSQFKGIMKGLMAVPRAEVMEREQAHKAEAAKNPNRRGPKPKAKRG